MSGHECASACALARTQGGPQRGAAGRGGPRPGGRGGGGEWPKSGKVPNALWASVPPGTSTVTIRIPEQDVKRWVTSKSKSNYGLLLKLVAGSEGAADIMSSLHGDQGARPALSVAYQTH